MDDKHIMVSLGDEKVKEISEVIGNKSCNRILDFLADGNSTVSEISERLKMPINTVDYNIKKLVSAGLIEKASHWWSVKGKKMPTYKVSNKKIIISPKKSMAKVFAWVIGLTGLVALTIRQAMYKSLEAASPIIKDSSEVLMTQRAGDVAGVASSVGEEAVLGAEILTENAPRFFASLSPWSWFLIGAWFAVVLFFVVTLITERRRKI